MIWQCVEPWKPLASNSLTRTAGVQAFAYGKVFWRKNGNNSRLACIASGDAAAEGRIVTFGIRPAAPKTGYGYIRPGAALGHAGVHAFAAYVEEADEATAVRYVADGHRGTQEIVYSAPTSCS